MNLDNGSVFLVGSILYMLGFVIIAIGAVVINNIFHKYWKPVTVFSVDSWTLFGSTSSQNYIDNHPEMLSVKKEEEKNDQSRRGSN